MPGDVPDWSSSVVTGEQPVPGSPFTVARDGAVHDLGSVSLTPGTQAIGFTFATPIHWTQIQVIGNVSGVDYGSKALWGIDGTVTVKVFPGVDTAVDLKATAAASVGTDTFNAVFLFGTRVVSIDPSEPGGVFLETNQGSAVGSDTNSAGVVSVAASLHSANPAPWQAQQGQGSNTGLVASGGNVVVLPAVVGQQYYLGDSTIYTPDAAGAIAGWQDTTSTSYGQGSSEGSHSGQVFKRHYGGKATGANVGMRVFNPGGAGSNLYWSISFTLAP